MKTTNNWIKICAIGIVLLGLLALLELIWFYEAWGLASIMVVFGTAFLAQKLLTPTNEKSTEVD